MNRVLIFLALTLFVHATPAQAADTVLGRWCDHMLPAMPQYNRVIAIKVLSSGEAVAVYRFADGAPQEQPLVEQDGRLYRVKDSPHGDRYRIVSSTGDLQLIDNDGLIRVASRLENDPQPGDCLK